MSQNAKTRRPLQSWQTKGSTGSHEFEEMITTGTSENQASKDFDVLRRLSHLKLPPHDLDPDHHDFVAQLRWRQKRSARYAGRAQDIAAILQDRHGGPCDTDDAEIWLDAALPFVVEAAEIEGRSAIITGMAWARTYCPAVPLGDVADRIDEILDDRSMAAGQYWLPRLPALAADLSVTFEQVTRLGLRGWPSIDRPDDEALRARKQQQDRQRRKDAGGRSRSEQTITRDLASIATKCGVTLRTVERWKQAGIIDEKVAAARVGKAHVVPTDYTACELPTSTTSPEAAQTIELSLATLGEIRREAETKAILEFGFPGENFTFRPETLQAVVDRHPVLRPDLARHAATVDRLMRKTPPDNARRVARNLFADQARSTSRAATKATKLAA